MIQFARVIGLEVSLDTFGTLEDLLLKIKSKVGRCGAGGERVSFQSLFPNKAVRQPSMASRSFHFLPTITESVTSNPLPDPHYQQPCSSRQADEALGIS